MPEQARKPPIRRTRDVTSPKPPAPRPAGLSLLKLPWPLPPTLLGVLLGSIALGLILLHLLCHAVGPAASPGRLAGGKEEADSDGFADLYMLALMEQQDGPLSHEFNMVLLAADLAKRNYYLDGSDKKVPNTERDLAVATCGLRMLYCPDDRPFRVSWRLDRGNERETNLRNYVLVSLPDGHYSGRMNGRWSGEWGRASSRLPNEVIQAGSDLIDEADWIYTTDNDDDEGWDGPEGKPYTILQRKRVGQWSKYYRLKLAQTVGDYHLNASIMDSFDDQPGSCKATLWFIYRPDEP